MNNLRLRVTSTANLNAFLKKLKVVDKSVLLELTEEKIFSKVHTPDKSVMKYAAIENSSVFEDIQGWEDLGTDRIIIGIMDITRLMDSFRYFRPEEEVFLNFSLSEVDGSISSTMVIVESDSLKIKIRCADMNLLSYVEDKVLGMVHDKESAEGSFKIYSSDFSSLASLCGMETDNQELLKFTITPKKVQTSGNSFDYTLNMSAKDIKVSSELVSKIYKSQLNFVDLESSTIYIHDNRLVIFSDQSETSTAVGIIEE